MKQFFFWASRILSSLMSLFILSFSLEAFMGEFVFLDFLVMLIPGIILIIATLISFKWELPGGIIFLGLAVFYLVLALTQGAAWSAIAFMSGVLAIIGVLYILSFTLNKKTNLPLVPPANF